MAPIAFAVIQILLMLTCFRFDTPVALKQKGETVALSKLMRNIYKAGVVQERIDELPEAENNEGAEQSAGYGAVLCSPKFSKATFVGICLAIFQQLTGINFIMFYSNTIFASIGFKPQIVTFLVGTVNFLGTFGGLALLF